MAQPELTNIESRIVPWLPTCMSFATIGAQLELSEATVRAAAIALYRKLGAGCRYEAVERCLDVGLLPAAPAAAGSV